MTFPAILLYFLLYSILAIGISWILPSVLSWLFERKFHFVIKIGRISVYNFRLCDVKISTKGFSIHIDEVSFHSSIFNSEFPKLLTVVVKDARINKDAENTRSIKAAKGKDRGKSLDFNNKQIPQFVTTFAQFMAVHMHNISAVFLQADSPGCLFHYTATKLVVDASLMQNSSILLVNLVLSESNVKVLKHVNPDGKGQTCLGELNFAVNIEGTLAAQGPISIKKLYIGTGQISAVINDGIYGFMQEYKATREITSISSVDSVGLYDRIAPIIPKNFTLKVEETSVRGIKENSRTVFCSTLQGLIINSRFNQRSSSGNLPHVNFAFELNQIHLRNKKEDVLVLKSLNFNAKLEFSIIELLVNLNNISITYDHSTIYNWINSNILEKSIENSAYASENPSKLEKFLERCILNGTIDLKSISVTTSFSDSKSDVATFGFEHINLKLEQSREIRGKYYSLRLPRMLLQNRHWHTEFLIECIWWRSLADNVDGTFMKKQHYWGTPLFLGFALFQMGSHGSREIKIDGMLDALQMEWNPNCATFIANSLKCLKLYKKESKEKVVEEVKEIDKSNTRLSIKTALTNINFYFISEPAVRTTVRLDSLSLETSKSYKSIVCSGLKLADVVQDRLCAPCTRSEDMKDFLGHLMLTKIDQKLSHGSNETHIRFLDEFIFQWSTNLHLRIMHICEQIADCMHNVKSVLRIKSAPQICLRKIVNVSFQGNICLSVKVSSKHNIKLCTGELFLNDIGDNMSLDCSFAVISIDSDDIFSVTGAKMSRVAFDEDVKNERAESDGFQLPWNKLWGISIDSFKAIFPYEHEYADAVQNDFVSVFKWLKKVHKRQRPPFMPNSPLPSDILITVKEFIFEMSDDPFEVKLRDNYELLEDEYKESLKRQKMLDGRVSDLFKTHLHLPAGKVEELYANLSKKNAEIYVQRSKQMYAVAMRTRLFASCMNDLKIIAMADPSMHGSEKVIRTMRDIDPDSPWPEEGLDFTILWCRSVSFACKEWKILLRDFPQPMVDVRQFYLCGTLVGAEQGAPRRARRDVSVELGKPWGTASVERSMTQLKFYHDFNCEVELFSYAFGPCWEPVMAMYSMCFEKIAPPSRDPSPPLPVWDKMRLLFHGRLTMVIKQMTLLLHASLDPYNTTEEMEITWKDVAMDWTNAKFVYKGDLNVFVRTASKYDDCRLLYLPNLKLTVKVQWICLSDPNDHHSVIPCAPDKLPEYSSNQEHDSFRAFRSQNVNIRISLETKPVTNQSPTEFNCPILLLYGSTLRWFENLKLILSGVTRPTKRGAIFGNVRPRKLQLSRHYKKVHLLISLHKFQVCYWMSFAMQRGLEVIGGRIWTSSEHALSLVPIDDGLKHRPKSEWAINYMTCELSDSEIWLKSALPPDANEEALSPIAQMPQIEKYYCLSVAKVSYGRETLLPSLSEHSASERLPSGHRETPTHRLVVHDLKGAWTQSNRNVAFALFDAFMKTKQLKKNLSTEALKGFRCETNSTPLKARRNTDPPGTPPPGIQAVPSDPSPMTKMQSNHAAAMLQQLIAEADNKSVVFSDDLSTATRQQHLQGLQACQEDDVQHKNWLIALVNSQVLLKGCETKGYIIVSAAKAEILQRIHRPVWKDRTLVSKTTWVGSLECLQYYATVSAGESDSLDENIMWITVDNIQEKDLNNVPTSMPDISDLVGSGQSVGGVVSQTVGGTSLDRYSPVQLQRIASRCKCEFFYAGYGDSSVDPESIGEVPPPPQEDVGPWEQRESAVDAFTLMHHDLDVCTNSLQYAMLLDIINNLLLYVEPCRKEALERLARMRFQLQLNSFEDQRRPIQHLQNQVRSLVSRIRRIEKEMYQVQKTLAESDVDLDLLQEKERLDLMLNEYKECLTEQSEELDMMLSCYKERQLSVTSRLATTRKDKPLTIVRASEICFKHAKWRLTDADGQLGIADLLLSNFLYTKTSKSDNSVEHLLELGYIRMTNLLPNQRYQEVLFPTEIQSNMPVEQKRVLRVFCREKPPVGGISVKEHFEINVVPITIALTKKFYDTMLKFCFPERDPENIEGENGEEIDSESRGKKVRSSKRQSKDTNFYVKISYKDDVEKMKERAEKNKLFIYIKIPEVPVKVSYKGNKEKNIVDIRDFSLLIPTLEYHNVTWTWLDLLLAMKSDSRRVLFSQAIKQKLQINRNRGSTDESTAPQEEDKARLLFGKRLDTDSKSLKKGVSGVFKSK